MITSNIDIEKDLLTYKLMDSMLMDYSEVRKLKSNMLDTCIHFLNSYEKKGLCEEMAKKDKINNENVFCIADSYPSVPISKKRTVSFNYAGITSPQQFLDSIKTRFSTTCHLRHLKDVCDINFLKDNNIEFVYYTDQDPDFGLPEIPTMSKKFKEVPTRSPIPGIREL